ncbi:MAG: 3-deoxy-manno-octulosonate cytidylyltransferase [Bacteroidales bacterium]|nr:3-deoxy-manno-octulosonate cytidylyltransferase [Bacteroidales bacterium]MDZ4205472.1 3-deoxy-manno-octulosonate cytidylyltransferase [Bacteroidales bacterium]
MSNIICIIPSRYTSTRFPGKPLVDIGGKTMIQRVYEQVRLATAIHEVYIATDDVRIFNHVETFGGNVIMTSPNHDTGTERCLEAYQVIAAQSGKAYDVVINVQGDEPFIVPSQIDLLAGCFSEPDVKIATLVMPINDVADLSNSNVVKVVVDFRGQALYFSRSAVPHVRGYDAKEWINHHKFYKHIGMYAWRSEVLPRICSLPPSPLEKAESLEQLRWLGNGFSILTKVTDHETVAIDTPEDLLKLTNIR